MSQQNMYRPFLKAT